MSKVISQKDAKPNALSTTELTRMMMMGKKVEVLKYLRTLPHEESAKMRKKLLHNIENIQNRVAVIRNKKSISRSSSSESRKRQSHEGSSQNESNESKGNTPNSQKIVITYQSAVERANIELEGKYKSGEVIGRGGFGTVLKGYSLETGDFVAIKQIDKDLIDESQIPGVMKEYEILKKLNHPNILKIHSFIETANSIYFIMEYVESGSLAGLVKKFGVFPEPLVARYIEQTLRGLDYLHREFIIHRDIKGDNILITKEGKVKLADFGTAKLEDAEKKTQTVVGTPYWMAPEVIEMSACGPASDIWSLGCTAIELLTGSPPYFEMGPMSALFNIVEDRHPPLPDNISDEMKSFLKLCFKKDPKKRPNASDLLEHVWIKNNMKDCDIPVDLETTKGTLKRHNTIRKKNILNVNWDDDKKVRKLESKIIDTSNNESSKKTVKSNSDKKSEEPKQRGRSGSKSKTKYAKEKSRLESMISKLSEETNRIRKEIKSLEIVLEQLTIESNTLKSSEKVIKSIRKKVGESTYDKLSKAILDDTIPRHVLEKFREKAITFNDR